MFFGRKPLKKKNIIPEVLAMEQIEEILQKCYPGMKVTVLSAEESSDRARMIYEDMTAVGFPLLLDQAWVVTPPGVESVYVPTYQLPKSGYGPQADSDGTLGRDAAGPLLSCGEFIRLSRACKIGRDFLTRKRWPSHFTARLRDSEQHLAVIEEMIWLGRWHTPSHVKMSYRHNPANNSDIDWRFKSCNQVINLEVKTRRRDWMGLTDGSHFSRDFDSYFDDVEGKFGLQKDNELNVITITTFAPPDASLRRCTQRYLDQHPEVDAVVFWAIHDPKNTRPEIHAREPGLIQLLLKGSEREDDLFISSIRHLWRKRDERRAMRSNEVIAAIAERRSNPR